MSIQMGRSSINYPRPSFQSARVSLQGRRGSIQKVRTAPFQGAAGSQNVKDSERRYYLVRAAPSELKALALPAPTPFHGNIERVNGYFSISAEDGISEGSKSV